MSAYSLNQAYSYCQKLAQSHYENFPVASRLLPQESRASVAVIYAFALLSLVGLPPSTGFFAKIGLLQASADAGGWEQWVFITVICVAAVATLLAMQRLWSGVFWGPTMENYRPESQRGGRERRVPLPRGLHITWQLSSPAAFLVTLQLVFFVLAGALIPIALRAADDLLVLQPYVEAVLG